MKEFAEVDVASYIGNELKAHFDNPESFWLQDLYKFIDNEIDEFVVSNKARQSFDRAVKAFIESELLKHHSALAKMIEERFNKWSDDELTEFVESRVDDDLQMIRINGAVVGAIVGMGLFVLVWVTEKVVG